MRDDKECQHLNFVIRGNDPMSKAYCPDCGEILWLSDCFNDLAKRMQAVLKQFSED